MDLVLVCIVVFKEVDSSKQQVLYDNGLKRLLLGKERVNVAKSK